MVNRRWEKPVATAPGSDTDSVMQKSPFVSIIIPVREDAVFIERSLRAVLAQDYGPDRMEVIVADGLSEDGTRELVSRISGSHPNVRLIDNPGRLSRQV